MEEALKKVSFRLEESTVDLVARSQFRGGVTADPPDFRRPTQAMEECRDARRTGRLDDLWRDFRNASRTLRRKPGFVAVARCTLALGIGATTLMFHGD
jgi:hypothetical protein